MKESVPHKWILYFIIFATLISIRFWSFQAIPDRVYDWVEILVLFFLLVLTVKGERNNNNYLFFKNNVILMMIIPLAGSIPALVYHDQPVYYSLLQLRTILYWTTYFILHKYNIPAKNVVSIILFIGFSWAIINIVQQFTYPYYIFYTRTEDTGELLRSGVYRFMPFRHHYGLFVIFYFFWKFLSEKKNLYFVYSVIALVGVYCMGTRQFLAMALFCMIITVFMQGTIRRKTFGIFVVLLVGFMLYIYRDVLFGELINMTVDQMNDAYIRVLEFKFYMFEFWPHWITYLLGNGKEHAYSSYGYTMEGIHEVLKLYRVDIGIFGSFNTFGIFYVFNVIVIHLKGLQSKFYTIENKYLKLIFINSFLLIGLSDYFTNHSAIIFFCLVFYLVDKKYQDCNVKEQSVKTV